MTVSTTFDPCIYCGDPTAFGAVFRDGSPVGKFINRIPATCWDEETDEHLDGFACGECAGFECSECEEPIYIDCETRVEFEDEDGKFHYGNYHTECYNESKHGKANYGENIEETE